MKRNNLSIKFLKSIYSNCFENDLNIWFIYLSDSRICREFSISPKTVVELGLIAIEEHDYEEAEKYLNRSIHDYSGYLFENYVHLKAYGALRLMGISIDQQNADESKRNQIQNR